LRNKLEAPETYAAILSLALLDVLTCRMQRPVDLVGTAVVIHIIRTHTEHHFLVYPRFGSIGLDLATCPGEAAPS